MSDPWRSDSESAPGASGDANRQLRIEQLLLSGLDHYFAGDYEQAINVWTRVVFLERGHDRARAYIERARSALSERHRESEELLHRGVAAYQAGHVREARELLTRAVEQGGPHDMALVFLERLSRLEPPVASAPGVAIPNSPLSTAKPISDPRVRLAPPSATPRGRWGVALLVAVAVAAVAVASGLPVMSWVADFQEPAEVRPVQPTSEPVPVVRAAEITLDRARALYANGRLTDALHALDRIGLADPLRAEADRLRADVQRELLAAGAAETSSSGDAGTQP
jgi:tetratricopeptide (TPR) repeat protein